MQSLANRLGVRVGQLMGAIDEVGAWIPAIERKPSAGMYGSSCLPLGEQRRLRLGGRPLRIRERQAHPAPNESENSELTPRPFHF
jgi:hypothetical protein